MYLATTLLFRHDVLEAFKGGNAGKVNDLNEMVHKGIVTDDCFQLLFDQSQCQKSSMKALSKEDIWNFLLAFQLASEIEDPMSLYIPALIPDLKEAHLKQRLADISKSEVSRGFYYSFKKCDRVIGLFNRLLCQLASRRYFYKTEDPGITFEESFSAKIENRRLGIVAAMAGRLQYFDQDQCETDEIEFIVAEKDCNHFDDDRRFARHKVSRKSYQISMSEYFLKYCVSSRAYASI